MSNPPSTSRRLAVELAVMLLLLTGVLATLLHGVFTPNHTLFSNDGPLGRLISDCHKLPDRFTGCWSDLNSIGGSGGASPTGISLGLLYLLKPIWFSKLYALLALTILGLGAWCFFVQLRLAPVACALGAVAAALNSSFFGVACWGVAAQAINAGLLFFALAALADPAAPRPWLRVILAGFAVGMGVVEGSDIGAIYSLYVVAFILFQAALASGSPLVRLTTGLSRVAIVTLFAVFIAAQAISSLIGTSIEGVVGTGQDAETKAAHWDFATQWSLPVEETAGLAVPGLFGYRMDTPNGGSYWGRIGQDPAVTRYLANGRPGPPPRGFIRYTGGGFYAGVLVLLVSLWTAAQLLRGPASCFTTAQRPWLWFWLIVGFTALLLAYGRFAPFYQLIYALPYFSTIRNPIKFINLVSLALVVLFAYGVDGLWRLYMQPATPAPPPRMGASLGGKNRTGSFDKLCLRTLWGLVGLCFLAWVKYASDTPSLRDYLLSVQIKASAVDDIASFSVRQFAWFLACLILAATIITAILRGGFAGARARWGALALGLFLVADLGRANLPWIIYWNYAEKYATNPIIERLRDKPYEHRLVLMPGQPPPNLAYLNKVYRLEWLQQQFPFYNIQTLDIIEMPRVPADLAAYAKATGSIPNPTGMEGPLRLWQLTSCRYVLGLADAFDTVNQNTGASPPPFRCLQRFNLVPKPGTKISIAMENMTATLDDQGPYALCEYTRALPRAKLFTQWEINPNNEAVLADLADPSYDFSQRVLVSNPATPPSPVATSLATTGTVTFASYTPKDILLKSDAAAAGVLLFNDHYDPDWHVFVDGKPQTLLRCNFIMRGVYLTAGAHTVEFKFQPPYRLMYVSLTALALAVLVLILVLLPSPASGKTQPTDGNIPGPQSSTQAVQEKSASEPGLPVAPAPLNPTPSKTPNSPTKPVTVKKPGQATRPGRR